MLKIHSRDRQAIFFSVFFPLVFMFVISFASSNEAEPIELGIVNNANNDLATDFIASLDSTRLFNITLGEASSLPAKPRSPFLKPMSTADHRLHQFRCIQKPSWLGP